MSYGLSGFPGIRTAVRHLVCGVVPVDVSAPGPWHGGSAIATLVVASNMAPNSAAAKNEASTAAFENPLSLGILKIRIIAGLLVANRHCESYTSLFTPAQAARDSAEAADSRMTSGGHHGRRSSRRSAWCGPLANGWSARSAGLVGRRRRSGGRAL